MTWHFRSLCKFEIYHIFGNFHGTKRSKGSIVLEIELKDCMKFQQLFNNERKMNFGKAEESILSGAKFNRKRTSFIKIKIVFVLDRERTWRVEMQLANGTTTLIKRDKGDIECI